jgi:hypothetical protein
MTTFQKLTSLRFGPVREPGHLTQEKEQYATAKPSPRKAQNEQDKALIMSFYPHGSAGAIRLNLRWRGIHQINEFTFDSAGEVQECQTETEHTGWVILRPHRSFHVKFLFLGEGISYTGLYYGAKFPLTLTAKKGDPVRQQSWCYFWRFVRQPWKEF